MRVGYQGLMKVGVAEVIETLILFVILIAHGHKIVLARFHCRVNQYSFTNLSPYSQTNAGSISQSISIPYASGGADGETRTYSFAFIPPETGHYTFPNTVDDGAAMIVDGTVIYDLYNAFCAAGCSYATPPSIYLTKGKAVNITILFIQGNGPWFGNFYVRGPQPYDNGCRTSPARVAQLCKPTQINTTDQYLMAYDGIGGAVSSLYSDSTAPKLVSTNFQCKGNKVSLTFDKDMSANIDETQIKALQSNGVYVAGRFLYSNYFDAQLLSDKRTIEINTRYPLMGKNKIDLSTFADRTYPANYASGTVDLNCDGLSTPVMARLVDDCQSRKIRVTAMYDSVASGSTIDKNFSGVYQLKTSTGRGTFTPLSKTGGSSNGVIRGQGEGWISYQFNVADQGEVDFVLSGDKLDDNLDVQGADVILTRFDVMPQPKDGSGNIIISNSDAVLNDAEFNASSYVKILALNNEQNINQSVSPLILNSKSDRLYQLFNTIDNGAKGNLVIAKTNADQSQQGNVDSNSLSVAGTWTPDKKRAVVQTVDISGNNVLLNNIPNTADVTSLGYKDFSTFDGVRQLIFQPSLLNGYSSAIAAQLRPASTSTAFSPFAKGQPFVMDKPSALPLFSFDGANYGAWVRTVSRDKLLLAQNTDGVLYAIGQDGQPLWGYLPNELVSMCPTDFTWNGTQCEKVYVHIGCPTGFSDNGQGQCIKASLVTKYKLDVIGANSSTLTTSKVGTVQTTSVSISCPSGYTFNGAQCQNTVNSYVGANAKVYASGGNVQVTILGGDAGYTSMLRLESPFFRDIGKNKGGDVGRTVDLGSFAAGTELVFSIYVYNTGQVFYTGDAARNPDGVEHARIYQQGSNFVDIGFDDSWNAGDRDYNDMLYRFTGLSNTLLASPTYNCPSGYSFNGSVCAGTFYYCPAGYTDQGGTCFKTVYSCGVSGYSVNASNKCEKTVPDCGSQIYNANKNWCEEVISVSPQGNTLPNDGRLYATKRNVTVTVLPADAGYTSTLSLYSPKNVTIGTNRDVGKVVDLGQFEVGTELVFGIYVQNTGNTFKTGDSLRNPDVIEHARATPSGVNLVDVGFEDTLGGGDRDYNDNMYRFTGTTSRCPPNYIYDGVSKCIQYADSVSSFLRRGRNDGALTVADAKNAGGTSYATYILTSRVQGRHIAALKLADDGKSFVQAWVMSNLTASPNRHPIDVGLDVWHVPYFKNTDSALTRDQTFTGNRTKIVFIMNNLLYVKDAATGLDEFPPIGLPANTTTAPKVIENRVIVGNESGTLFALNLLDKATGWVNIGTMSVIERVNYLGFAYRRGVLNIRAQGLTSVTLFALKDRNAAWSTTNFKTVWSASRSGLSVSESNSSSTLASSPIGANDFLVADSTIAGGAMIIPVLSCSAGSETGTSKYGAINILDGSKAAGDFANLNATGSSVSGKSPKPMVYFADGVTPKLLLGALTNGTGSAGVNQPKTPPKNVRTGLSGWRGIRNW